MVFGSGRNRLGKERVMELGGPKTYRDDASGDEEVGVNIEEEEEENEMEIADWEW